MYMYCTGYTGARQYFVMDSTIGDIIAPVALPLLSQRL